MQHDSTKYLRDMLEFGQKILRYAKDRTFDDFLNDEMRRDAILWNYCLIGEALSQMKRIYPATAERITDHWKIIGLRNQLIHGYEVIEDEITWRIIQNKLPILIKEIVALLAE
ncbi:MAG TPA: HepT-like ribonuclease domain-containing protein [Tepidisphaeraceae bacterium]|jgi:uncharacterized protein with HEPN domain